MTYLTSTGESASSGLKSAALPVIEIMSPGLGRFQYLGDIMILSTNSGPITTGSDDEVNANESIA